MNDIKFNLVVNNDRQPTIKSMMYGGSKPLPPAAIWSNLYRLRRGFPVPRRGKVVVATPQFKTLTLYSPISGTAQIPSTTVTPVSITYPTIAK